MGIIDACLNGRRGYAGKAYFFKGKIQFRDSIVLKQELLPSHGSETMIALLTISNIDTP